MKELEEWVAETPIATPRFCFVMPCNQQATAEALFETCLYKTYLVISNKLSNNPERTKSICTSQGFQSRRLDITRSKDLRTWGIIWYSCHWIWWQILFCELTPQSIVNATPAGKPPNTFLDATGDRAFRRVAERPSWGAPLINWWGSSCCLFRPYGMLSDVRLMLDVMFSSIFEKYLLKQNH